MYQMEKERKVVSFAWEGTLIKLNKIANPSRTSKGLGLMYVPQVLITYAGYNSFIVWRYYTIFYPLDGI